MKSLIAFLLLTSAVLHAEEVKVMGSSIVQPPVSDVAKRLRKEQGLEIDISVSGGIGAGLAALANGNATLVMMARELQPEDRATYPGVMLTQDKLGYQVAALCVSADVWNSGIHKLSAEQVRGIYEGVIKNWKELGGADQKITFFNWEEGLGMWELLSTWLYGSTSRSPKGKFTSVESNEEARNAVEFTKGSIGVMSPKMASADTVYPISLSQGGLPIEPTHKNVVSGDYSLSRPLVIVYDDRPRGSAKLFVDYLLSPLGQECFSKRGFFTVSELEDR